MRAFGEHKKPVRHVVVARNGEWFATSNSEGRVIVRTMTGEVRRELDVPWHSEPPDGRFDGVTELVATTDSRSLITGGIDRAIRVWDVETGEVERQLDGHEAFITAMQISGDGRVLVSADETSRALVWDLVSDTSKERMFDPDGQTGFDNHIQTVDVSHDGKDSAKGTTLRIGD